MAVYRPYERGFNTMEAVALAIDIGLLPGMKSDYQMSRDINDVEYFDVNQNLQAWLDQSKQFNPTFNDLAWQIPAFLDPAFNQTGPKAVYLRRNSQDPSYNQTLRKYALPAQGYLLMPPAYPPSNIPEKSFTGGTEILDTKGIHKSVWVGSQPLADKPDGKRYAAINSTTPFNEIDGGLNEGDTVQIINTGLQATYKVIQVGDSNGDHTDTIFLIDAIPPDNPQDAVYWKITGRAAYTPGSGNNPTGSNPGPGTTPPISLPGQGGIMNWISDNRNTLIAAVLVMAVVIALAWYYKSKA